MRKRTIIMLVAAAIFLGGCQNSTKATTMRLVKAEGTVGVTDGDRKDVALIDQLSLYSGYQVETQSQSYAWIDLDDVKLTKMDEDTEVEIQKSGKELEILVNSGSLFFNVTKPLLADETMTIRRSNMTVGIRGTCGWVEVEEENHLRVSLLKGTILCTVTDPDSGNQITTEVNAGETALLTEWKEGKEGSITVEELSYQLVPDFVETELAAELAQEVRTKAEEEREAEAAGNTEEEQTAEETDSQEDSKRRMALLNELSEAEADGRAMYVYKTDLNDDGMEDLLFFGVLNFPSNGGHKCWAFSACLWDGQQTRLVELTNTPGDYLDVFGASGEYGIYRERTTGDIYVHYSFAMDSVVNCTFVSIDDMVELGYTYDYETEEGRADGEAKKRQMEADMDSRFELVQAFDIRGEGDYTTSLEYTWNYYWSEGGIRPAEPPFYDTLEQVREELMSEGMAGFGL